MSLPKRKPAPLGLNPHPTISLIWNNYKIKNKPSGSDQSKSLIDPSCGISYYLLIFFISSTVSIVGDNPPCTQKISSSIIAAKLKKSKISVQYFQTLRLPYLRKHSS